MQLNTSEFDTKVAVLVDCENAHPDILDYALCVAAQFGRVVLRRGFGNHAALANKWQSVLVQQAFTPCLQYTYAAGKNTSDIALAIDAMEALFDQRATTFCLVTSDSDFAGLCRKLRDPSSSLLPRTGDRLCRAVRSNGTCPSATGLALSSLCTGRVRPLDSLR